MWAGIVGWEPVGRFKVREDMKINLKAYCKYLNQNFTVPSLINFGYKR